MQTRLATNNMLEKLFTNSYTKLPFFKSLENNNLMINAIFTFDMNYIRYLVDNGAQLTFWHFEVVAMNKSLVIMPVNFIYEFIDFFMSLPTTIIPADEPICHYYHNRNNYKYDGELYDWIIEHQEKMRNNFVEYLFFN